MCQLICTKPIYLRVIISPILFTDISSLIFQYVDHRYIADLLPSVELDTCKTDTAIQLMPS